MVTPGPGPQAALLPSSLLSPLYTYQTGTEIGTMLSSVLFGIFIVQLHQYFTSSTSEPLRMKCFVCPIIMFIEVAHIVFLWIYVVDMNHGGLLDPTYLIRDTWPVISALLMSGIAGATVQSFYAHRIFRFSGSIWLSIPSWAGSIARAGITIAGCVASLTGFGGMVHTVLDWNNKYKWALRGVLAASVAVDVLNATILCIFLSRRRDANTRTSRVINKLSVWAIETGMLTSVLAVIMLLLVLFNHIELLPAFIHIYPNMFSLSLLLSLNAREGLRQTLFAKPVVSSSNPLVVRRQVTCQTFAELPTDTEMEMVKVHMTEPPYGSSAVNLAGSHV
ncbi:hypothetical protein EXIGLDRAFT_669662 [Exidia glandulosa HHB12029]|uniref:DUF6534 domain-containing protein n=1 Tax=Exidia glandulosa HHB12029 TaxID=1314781 RepID=A0A165LPI2_EXIGL|nr:hypothetical protein EXIGLDRAFT_669662 [Exidia glandulosa HHB12029]